MRLRDRFGALLLDLDGTLFRGHEVIPGAPEALSASADGQRLLYVTNNASRSATGVAGHLRELGFAATEDEVVTSAQAAAHLLASRLSPGATVLVVGTDDLVAEIEAVGLQAIRRFNGIAPAGVVQGHNPNTAWADLAEAAYALRAGAFWVAANTDATLPNERGLAPGNGSMVAALRTASDRDPIVAGKPFAPLMEDALTRAATRDALVVGDRLNTDIDGAHTVGLESLMVLTGVSTLADLRAQPADRLPTYVAESLDALNHPVADTAPIPSGADIADEITARLRAHPGRAVPVSPPPAARD
ncbi:HAD-IIA family hydrolase [Nocardia huaxiensis]|uniref:HAD-IIA family hydrolase n=1 Tax=Nocardia huaxiensis TaxID=2755382 RepID=A0A7D6Z5Y0_9NOCA|nr:HAD-IIA family hydrolase [Nocardia huaxiensis]QLY33886.1 HAD-IIA family hydrolase [Nocardia huaxiensis]UFS99183.1 HAD-IIA family hydrolase [Nocardia huaxiensis]